jgi:hypothetical protein
VDETTSIAITKGKEVHGAEVEGLVVAHGSSNPEVEEG